MGKKKLLFINQSQFGYHIDYAQYCKYLKDDFTITYLCWDYKNTKIEEPGINIKYISRDGNSIKRNIRFIQFALRCLKENKYYLVFINYFKGCSFISLFNHNNQKLHIDFRTGSIYNNQIKRFVSNKLQWLESFFFKNQSIISVGLRNQLGINRNAIILPLGANPQYINRNCHQNIHLLYIGTFYNRRLKDTIVGFNLFLKTNPHADIHYTIVGDGLLKEKKEIQEVISKYEIQDYIDLVGYVPHNELTKYFEMANVGVSYIPCSSYFEFQPATKTFEYLLAGMPVIATNTYENKQVINEINGILIDDNPQNFANAINHMYNHHNTFNEYIIRNSVINYEWKQIIKKMKETILV